MFNIVVNHLVLIQNFLFLELSEKSKKYKYQKTNGLTTKYKFILLQENEIFKKYAEFGSVLNSKT